jgi:hypothetical protein
MQDFKYFTYGYSPDSRNPIYGLYQPVLNCFLIVFPDYDSVGPKLTAILSSRYLLQPVRIDVADNYTHNVIDNEICENWAISNFEEIIPNNMITAAIKVIQAKQLLPSVSARSTQTEKEKQWAQFCLFWLRFIAFDSQFGSAGLWIDHNIGNLDIFNIFEPLLSSDYNKFVQKTMSLLYLGQDLEKTEQAIISLVNNANNGLKDRFNIFSEGYNESTKNITNKLV